MQGMYSMRSPAILSDLLICQHVRVLVKGCELSTAFKTTYAVKRLMKEAQELREPTEQFHAQPLDDNLFEWHFTIRGPVDSEFDGGLYHGRIVLPPEYPMRPPSIIILTHNGRFEVNKKICLSISGHHPESWQPSWSIRTAMLAIIGFMPTHGAGALGSLDYTPEERKVLAKRSQNFKCSECGSIINVLKPVTAESEKTRQEIKELASQIDFKDEKEKNEALKATKESPNNTEGPTDTSSQGEPQPEGASSQQLPPNPFGNLTGQFPFRMPFMPPFPMPQPQTQNTTGSTNLAQVPRFPLPFVSPFLPPPPNMMHSGNGQGFPSMVPPWPPAMGMGTRPPFVPPNQGEQVTITRTEVTNVETIASATPTESQNDTTNVSSVSSGATNGGKGQETQQTTEESQTPDTSNSGEDSSLRSRTTGVRRRLAASVRPEESAGGGQTVTTAQATTSNNAPARPRQSESPVYILFVSLLVVAILLLVLRRLYIMKMLPVLF